MNIAIVGAGILGYLFAWQCAQNPHWKITLYEKNVLGQESNCSYAAAGMLSPISELTTCDPLIAEMGFDSLSRWVEWLPQLDSSIYFSQKGSLLIAHRRDRDVLDHLMRIVLDKLKNPAYIQTLSSTELHQREPALNQFESAYHLSCDAAIDNQALLRSLLKKIQSTSTTLKFSTEVKSLSPHTINTDAGKETFDWVIDCRGLGAKKDIPDLFAVRGELIFLHAPEVSLTHPVRFFHARDKLYVVPRENHHYLIGASEICAEDYSPISLRTSLDLLSAAYAIDKHFGEARIIKTVTHCRPTLPNHHPRVMFKNGLIHVNGLYRHGFLLSPTLVNEVMLLIQSKQEECRYVTDLH